MSDSTHEHLMAVSVRARQAGSTDTLSLAQIEGFVSVAKAENGTILIKIKPVKPTRIRRRRGKAKPPQLEFQTLPIPGCFWLEMNCLSLPQINLSRRE
ncbi:MAG: hypothetical protein ACKVZH_29350 [Blastocatellia bacterium]